MNERTRSAIKMTEACYDLEVEAENWFRNLMVAGLPLIDEGLGVAGLIGVKPPTPGPVDIREMTVVSGRRDFPLRHIQAMAEFPPEQLHAETIQGNVSTMSEQTAANPWMLEVWTRHVDHAKDGLGITALEPDGFGLHIMAALGDVTSLTETRRQELQMLAAHVASGHRLRRTVGELSVGNEKAEGGLPLDADAVIDPKRFVVEDAVRDARSPDAAEALREHAVAVDRARTSATNDVDATETLTLWRVLVDGRWSVVDWFDSDHRRYILALRNPPKVMDPRGLTERESHVVAYAALGENHKLIGYRLGLSRTVVTKALGSAMRKLGVKTQAQLVERIRTLAPEPSPDDEA